MCAQLADYFAFENKEKENTSNFRDSLNNYFYHWPLILIGVAFTLACAFVYLQLSTPVYETKATIIIHDETKAPDKSTLKDLLDNSPVNLAESEIEVLKSRQLSSQVVNKLQLWVTYIKKDGLKKQDLYKNSPIAFKLIDSTGYFGGRSFTVKINDDKSFYLKKSNDSLQKYFFKDRLINSFGVWKLEPTVHISDYKNVEITVLIGDPSKVAEGYQKSIDAVLPNKLSPAIELSLKNTVPQRGKDFLNALITYFNSNSIDDKNKVTRNTLAFVDKRIGSLAGELSNSEKDLQDFRSNNGLTDISSQSKVYLENEQSNDNKLNEVNVQLNIIEGIEDYVNSSQNVQSASASLGTNYPALNSLIEKLSVLQASKDKLLATTPESNPMFDPINRQITSAKADIKENIKNIKASLLAAKRKLAGYSTGFESSIKGIPVQERELIDKTRQKSIKETLYTYLLQKREELQMSYASNLNNAQIVDYAYSDSSQSQKMIVYGAAFLLGLVLPGGVLRGRTNFNNRITTKKEIEDTTAIPLFGEITYAKSESPLIINDRNNIPTGEEFRSLRTNLNFLKGKREEGMVVLMTSSISNEGKSFISSNLGLALAASGKKTIILEMDLRKPEISHNFELSLSVDGISTYLNGESPKEAIIQNSGVNPNLHIIGSGPLPHDPSELIEKEEVDYLINWLKKKYDFIIIDCPPINLVTDARILSRVTDVTFYVIRQAYTFKSLLPFIKSLVKEQKFPEMKFIFNAVERGRYGYGYNYGNEYYHAMGANPKKSMKHSFNDFLKRF